MCFQDIPGCSRLVFCWAGNHGGHNDLGAVLLCAISGCARKSQGIIKLSLGIFNQTPPTTFERPSTACKEVYTKRVFGPPEKLVARKLLSQVSGVGGGPECGQSCLGCPCLNEKASSLALKIKRCIPGRNLQQAGDGKRTISGRPRKSALHRSNSV